MKRAGAAIVAREIAGEAERLRAGSRCMRAYVAASKDYRGCLERAIAAAHRSDADACLRALFDAIEHIDSGIAYLVAAGEDLAGELDAIDHLLAQVGKPFLRDRPRAQTLRDELVGLRLRAISARAGA
jgi:hypothetical protein